MLYDYIVSGGVDIIACDPASSLSTPCMNLQPQMEHAIRASLSSQTLKRNVRDADSKGLEKSQLASVRSEVATFESTGVKGRGLQLVYDYLLSIPPASVEAERSFSAAGLLCTKIRSRLGDKSLDALCCIRSYYNNSKN
jgi:hypothetical protein